MNITHQKLTLARWLLLGSLIVSFLVIGGIEARRDGPTYDEPVYISSGLAAVKQGNLTVNAEHPPLFKVLTALPALIDSPRLPTATQRHEAVLLSRAASPQTAETALGQGDEYAYADAFTRILVKAHELRSVLFAARLVPLLLCAALALALYWLAAGLWGPSAGVLAASLWLISPLALGFGQLDGVDIPFSLATVLFARALLAWLRSPRRVSRVWLLGVAGGVSALANIDGLALAALGVAVVLIRSRDLRGALVVASAAWLTIWVPYVILNPGALSPALLPGPYVAGIRYLMVHDGGTQSYLLGMAWSGYRWWYLPLSLIVKLAPGTLIVLLAATACWLLAGRRQRHALVAIGAPALVLGVFELTIGRDIGVRYALPLLALWCASAGALVPAIRGIDARLSRRLAGSALAVAMLSAAVMTILSVPNSLAWTDPVFGASYRVATNSTVDWGQDYYALSDWSASHPRARVAYFGPLGLGYWDFNRARPLLGVEPHTISGWVAASATDLTTGSSLGWLRAYCPLRVIDSTLLIYRFRTPPTGIGGPATPAAVCSKRSFSVRVD